MAFTNEQLKAIHSSGSNILISAGAGSGKTTVLSERVIRILKSGIDVDKLIILTFTNAAAAEMKSRIKEKIGKINELKPQLAKLENARISTFDSFCLGLVKQYHYLLNLPESIEIADKILLNSIKSKLLDETMNELYIDKPDWFIATVDRFFDKGDHGLTDVLKSLDKGLEMIPDALNYLRNLPDMMFSEQAIDKSLNDFELLILSFIDECRENYQTFFEQLSSSDNEKVTEYCLKLEVALKDILNASTIDEILAAYQYVKFPIYPRVSKAIDEDTLAFLKSFAEPIKNAFEVIKKQFQPLMASSRADLKEALLETKPAVQAICRIVERYRNKLKQYQMEHHLFDFIDIMHLAIDLINNHPEVCQILKNNTYEIMVDEYQDTNDLQEFLVSLISNNNIFMVGDAKQSIYGFRNANPLNFIRKYHLYSQNSGGIAIDLNANFRSRKEVINGVNAIFNQVMSEEIGGIDYQNHQALIFGNEQYELPNAQRIDYSPVILSYHLDKNGNETQSVIEARIIAEKILDMVNNKTLVAKFNSKGIYYQPVKFQDFCILIDRKTDFSIFEKILTDASIPVDSIADEAVVASTEILFFSQLLKLMKCYQNNDYFIQHFKHAFYGVARSFVYEISDEEIVKVLINHPFKHVEDLEVLSDYPAFHRLHDDFKKLSSVINQSIPEIIDCIVETTRIYEYVALLDDPLSVERKLDFIFTKVRGFRQFQFDDLIAYFDEVYSNQDLDIEFSRPIDFSTDAVRIMTIHKSKGLEFSFCFYPGLDKSLQSQDQKQPTIFDRSYGLIIKSKKEYFYDNIWHNLWRNQKKRSDLSERIRLFYVALTRAKEKMFFLLNEETSVPTDIHYEEGYIALSQRLKFKCYHDFFDAVATTNNWKKPVTEIKKIISEKDYSLVSSEVTPIIFEPIHIKAETRNSSHYSKTIDINIDNASQRALSKGRKVHRLFEEFDFKHADKAMENISVDNQKFIKNFLKQPVMKSINIGIIYQEYPFTETSDGETKTGVIDLLILYEDHVDIIDYKLKAIDDPAYLSQLRGYKEHISGKTNKTVSVYLYSILDDLIKKIEV